jgi:hypothetical protein
MKLTMRRRRRRRRFSITSNGAARRSSRNGHHVAIIASNQIITPSGRECASEYSLCAPSNEDKRKEICILSRTARERKSFTVSTHRRLLFFFCISNVQFASPCSSLTSFPVFASQTFEFFMSIRNAMREEFSIF